MNIKEKITAFYKKISIKEYQKENKCCGNCDIVKIERRGEFVLIICRGTRYPIHPTDEACANWVMRTENTRRMIERRNDSEKPFGRNYTVSRENIDLSKEILSDEEKTYNTILKETSQKTGFSIQKIVKYDNLLDDILHDIKCPQCGKKYTSDYWRKRLNYPMGKIIKNNINNIKCNSCGFEWQMIINLDIDKIDE